MSALETYLIGEPDQEEIDGPIDTPEGLEQADWQLRRLARLRTLMADNESLAHNEMQRVRSWLVEENRKLEQKAAWIEHALVLFHQALLEHDPKRKTIALPAGQLRARKHPDRIEILDADVFIRWASATGRLEFIRTKVEPVKSEIKRLLGVSPIADADGRQMLVDPETGEPAKGVCLIPGETSFTADAARGPEEVES